MIILLNGEDHCVRLQDIFGIIQENFVIALSLVIVLGSLLAVGYFIVYRKFLKGSKRFSMKEIFIWFCLIGYIIIVIGVTFRNRGIGKFGVVNLQLFRSYKEAWYSFNSATWRYIYLNILMLVPLGVLLPLLHKRFRKFSWLIGTALLMTLTIEIVQLATGLGIFDLDDLFNNILGAVIGYGIVMAIIMILENKKAKLKRAIIYLMPLILVIAISLAIVGVYNAKEFGNLYIADRDKINMKNIELSLSPNIDISEQEVFLNNEKYSVEKVPIYKAPIYDQNSGEEFFVNFLRDKNIIQEIEVDQYNDMVIFWSRGDVSYNMWFDYYGGTYRYSDFSVFDVGIEKASTDETNLKGILAGFGIFLPDEAIFSRADHGIYDWSIENYLDGDSIINGRLSVKYYNDDQVKAIDNSIIKYKKVKDVSIKSINEAFQELVAGKFNLNQPKSVRTIEIEAIKINYMLDTKGFYQPIYQFTGKVDGEERIISIPAI